MKNMTIAICLPDFRGGGAEKVMITLGNEFHRRGAHVLFYVKKIEGPNRKNLTEKIKVKELNSNNPLKISYLLKKMCVNDNVDIALGTLGMAHILSLSNLFGNKSYCIARLGNTISLDIENWTGFKKIAMIFYQYVLFFSDHLIFQSKSMKYDFFRYLKVSINEDKYTQIYNPIDSHKIDKLKHEVIETEILPFDIISVGRLSEQKNYFLALDIFVIYLVKYPDSKYHILGTGHLLDPLKDYARKLNIESSIIFHGYIENPYPYLIKAGAFLLTSKYEGFSNSLLEAIYLNVPVVATDVPGGNSEIIINNENGFLFSEKDSISGANQLVNANNMKIEDNNIDKYSLNTICNKYIALFKSYERG